LIAAIFVGVAFAIIECEVAPSLKLFHKGQNIAVYFPKSRFSGVASLQTRVRLAILVVLIPGAGYTNMDLGGWLAGGALSTCKSWLAIPIYQYVSA
jgi:hypothetical protein